jgi:hypothetical protein
LNISKTEVPATTGLVSKAEDGRLENDESKVVSSRSGSTLNTGRSIEQATAATATSLIDGTTTATAAAVAAAAATLTVEGLRDSTPPRKTNLEKENKAVAVRAKAIAITAAPAPAAETTTAAPPVAAQPPAPAATERALHSLTKPAVAKVHHPISGTLSNSKEKTTITTTTSRVPDKSKALALSKGRGRIALFASSEDDDECDYEVEVEVEGEGEVGDFEDHGIDQNISPDNIQPPTATQLAQVLPGSSVRSLPTVPVSSRGGGKKIGLALTSPDHTQPLDMNKVGGGRGNVQFIGDTVISTITAAHARAHSAPATIEETKAELKLSVASEETTTSTTLFLTPNPAIIITVEGRIESVKTKRHHHSPPQNLVDGGGNHFPVPTGVPSRAVTMYNDTATATTIATTTTTATAAKSQPSSSTATANRTRRPLGFTLPSGDGSRSHSRSINDNSGRGGNANGSRTYNSGSGGSGGSGGRADSAIHKTTINSNGAVAKSDKMRPQETNTSVSLGNDSNPCDTVREVRQRNHEEEGDRDSDVILGEGVTGTGNELQREQEQTPAATISTTTSDSTSRTNRRKRPLENSYDEESQIVMYDEECPFRTNTRRY